MENFSSWVSFQIGMSFSSGWRLIWSVEIRSFTLSGGWIFKVDQSQWPSFRTSLTLILSCKLDYLILLCRGPSFYQLSNHKLIFSFFNCLWIQGSILLFRLHMAFQLWDCPFLHWRLTGCSLSKYLAFMNCNYRELVVLRFHHYLDVKAWLIYSSLLKLYPPSS